MDNASAAVLVAAAAVLASSWLQLRAITNTHNDALRAIRSTQLEEQIHGLTEDLAEYSLLSYYLLDDLLWFRTNRSYADPAQHDKRSAKAGVLYNRILLRLQPDAETASALKALRDGEVMNDWLDLNNRLMAAARALFQKRRAELSTEL